jgi:AcrR family transcriptional regulator
MRRPAHDTRQQIMREAHRLFRKRGFFRAGTDEIAEASHVTKRTLYHHFESKDALLAAVLSAQHHEIFASLEPYGVKLTGTPAHIVDILFDKLLDWSSTPHWSGSGFTRVAVELADMPGHPARVIAHQHKVAMESYLTEVLSIAGLAAPAERARELFVLLEGAMALILVHGDPSYAKAAAAAAKRLFSSEAIETRVVAKQASPSLV